MIIRIDLQKHTSIENTVRYVIFDNTYPYSMISIHLFDINNGSWDAVNLFS